jgi:uncharacterized membrane protein YfcA
MYEQILLAFISLIANTFSALAGGGAGLIQLPVLIFMGLPFSLALATHKVATVALGVGATIKHIRAGHTGWKFVFFMLIFGVPGVILGALFILDVADRHAEITLGILTLGLGIYSWIKPNLGLVSAPKHRDKSGFVLGGLGLFVIAFINGSLSAGSGLFATMWVVYWFGFEYKRAVTYVLIAVGLFWNASGAITMGIVADIHWAWLPALLFGSLLGGYLGAHLALKAGNQWIKRIYEIVTLCVGLKLIIG